METSMTYVPSNSSSPFRLARLATVLALAGLSFPSPARAQAAAPAAPPAREAAAAPAAPARALVKPATPSVVKTAKAGPGLYEVAASPSTGLVNVASVGRRGEPGTAKILGLDQKTLEVKKTIELGETAAFGLGINDKTQKLYTTNTRAGNVSAIDLASGKVVATIALESSPKAHVFRALVDEARNVVYVSETAGRVWVIDGATDTLTGTIEEVGETTVGLALDPARNQLFAANLAGKDIAVIDLATKKVASRIPVEGERPTQLAFDAKTRRLFVTQQRTGDIAVIDTAAGKQIKSIQTGAGALGIGFSAEKNRLYVANRQAGTVTVIDGTSLEVVEDIPAGTLPNTVAIDAKTHRVFVTNKAKGGPRNAAPTDDPSGDTVTLILP
jgi:YVTN family beta-propeller protein